MWDVELARKIMQQGRQKLPQVWHWAEVADDAEARGSRFWTARRNLTARPVSL